MTDENLNPEPEENNVDLPVTEEESSIPSEEQTPEPVVSKKQVKQNPIKQPPIKQYSPEDYIDMMKEVIRKDREEREIEKLKNTLPKEHLDYVTKYKMTNEQIRIFIDEINNQSEVNDAKTSSSQKPSIITNNSVKNLPPKKVVFHNNSADIDYIVKHYPDTKHEKLKEYRNGDFKVPSPSLRK